ncbi:AraC family transcriptional regulator [Cellvibrio sp. KY-YJ-3]|nr:AraC family transcriptional regulator [Cellvibrio sp. KY-YJ-3]
MISHENNSSSLIANFKLSKKSQWFGAGIAINFDQNVGRVVDFSEFTKARVLLKCSPSNTLYFGLSMEDEKVTEKGIPLTYRNAGAHINCDSEWSEVEINLDSLEVQVWWLHRFGFKASEKAYDLRKVIRIYLEAAYESPVDIESNLYVSGISFVGRKEGILLNFTLVMLAIWVLSGAWIIRSQLKPKPLEQEISPQLQYEPLDFNPARERDKQAIFEYIAKNFANPEIDIESVTKAAGVSRTKVNDILKAEYGTTFTNHINKLRLVEASRLLAEKPDAHITEIAYLVGFKNISYFNKLFKEQFGSTPKEVRGKAAKEN